MSSLESLDLSWERADDYYVAIDIHPKSNYQAVCGKLWEFEQNGTLEYKTCEARIPGSFDDVPADD